MTGKTFNKGDIIELQPKQQDTLDKSVLCKIIDNAPEDVFGNRLGERYLVDIIEKGFNGRITVHEKNIELRSREDDY